MQPLENPDNRAARDLHRTIWATAARTTAHAWSVPPRDMRHGLAASLARQIDTSSLALICSTAERRTSMGMQEPWLLLGGLRRKGEDIN